MLLPSFCFNGLQRIFASLYDNFVSMGKIRIWEYHFLSVNMLIFKYPNRLRSCSDWCGWLGQHSWERQPQLTIVLKLYVPVKVGAPYIGGLNGNVQVCGWRECAAEMGAVWFGIEAFIELQPFPYPLPCYCINPPQHFFTLFLGCICGCCLLQFQRDTTRNELPGANVHWKHYGIEKSKNKHSRC